MVKIRFGQYGGVLMWPIRSLFSLFFLALGFLGLITSPKVLSLSASDLLPAEEAFRLSHHEEPSSVVFRWDIADGYHLYRKHLKFASLTPGVELGAPDYPQGHLEHDDNMGDMEVYRGHLEVRVPLSQRGSVPKAVQLEVTAQGCADVGVCYRPHREQIAFAWPENPVVLAAAENGAQDLLKSLGIRPTGGNQELLPPDQAFRFEAEVLSVDRLRVTFRVAKGYYLYRQKFDFSIQGPADTALGPVEIPHGEPKEDPEFGSVEVFHEDITFELPLLNPGRLEGSLSLKASFQGCADRGVCYPPMTKTIPLTLEASSAGAQPEQAVLSAPLGECEVGPATGFIETEGLSEQCTVVDSLKKGSLWLTIGSFLGMGLLLAFTPCIFPMIPILSGLIVGHGHKMTAGRGFMLSLSYVLASALAYTVFGVLAALFGKNLQALFQDPKIIVAFSLVFVALALSMFDVFTLQVPGFLQSRLSHWSDRQKPGTLLGAAAMGGLSALIVGPCVAAPLAGTLIYISQTGDAVLGGVALFSLGLGMGLPLLVIGASAGRLLPRAGNWMNTVRAVFGVGLLAMAVWLLDRILPPAVTMVLWSLLLMVPSIYMGAIDALPANASGWHRLFKGLGVAMLAYGVLLLIGVAANQTDPLQPLRGLREVPFVSQRAKLDRPEMLLFKPVTSLSEFNDALKSASRRGQSVMLDFYADWCVSCKEMERYTFRDPSVMDALGSFVLLKADVTDNSEDNQALMKYFNLIGPPATLFFGADGEEQRSLRVIGFMEANDFVVQIQKVRH